METFDEHRLNINGWIEPFQPGNFSPSIAFSTPVKDPAREPQSVFNET